MAGNDTAGLVVALSAQLTKFEKDMQSAGGMADRQVRQIEDRFAKVNPTAGFLKNFAIGALGALSLERLATAAQRAIADLAKIGDQSDRIGITAEQLQELRFAVEQSGGEVDNVGPALERFANNIAKAADGDQKLGKFLNENNVALRDRAGVLRPTAELLGEVANLIKNAASPQERLNIAVEFFGRQAGPAMVTALSNGAIGLQSLGAQAQQTGTVLDNELIKKAQIIDDKWQQVARTFSTTLKGAVIEAIDAFQKFSEQAGIAAALDAGTTNAKQLASAITLARSKGSPVDPSWLRDLERLQELDREANRAHGGGGVQGSTLPAIEDKGSPTKTSGLLGGGEDAKSKFERAIAQAQKNLAVQNAETAAIDLGTAARARAKLEAELETAAKQTNADAGLKNTEVTAAQRVEIEKLAAGYGRAALQAEIANGPLRSFAREAANTNQQLQEATVSGLRGFEDALIGIIQGTKTAQEAFREMANAIIADLLRIAIRKAITGPIASGLGGLLGLPGLAGGTDDWSGGSTWVGENGPEILNLPRGSQVVPNDVARRMGGGGGITISLVNSPVFQAGMTPSDIASIQAMMQQNNEQQRVQIIDGIRTGVANDSRFLGNTG